MHLAKTSYTVTVIFILLSVIFTLYVCSIMWTIIISLNTSQLVNIPYQKDHNVSRFICFLCNYICNNVQHRIIVLYIAE